MGVFLPFLIALSLHRLHSFCFSQKRHWVDRALLQGSWDRQLLTPHQFVNRRHVTITVNPNSGKDGAVFDVIRHQLLSLGGAIVEDVVPLACVPDVVKFDIKLNRPEIRHTAIAHCTTGRIVPGQTPVLAGEAPVFNTHCGAATPVRKPGDVASRVDPRTGIERHIDHHAAVASTIETTEEIGGELDPDANDDKISGQPPAVFEHRALDGLVSFQGSNCSVQVKPHAVSLVLSLQAPPNLRTEEAINMTHTRVSPGSALTIQAIW